MHLATMGARIAIEELFKAISDYDIAFDQCERVYWEHLSGFASVPLRITLR
jgi:hypothetical protein